MTTINLGDGANDTLIFSNLSAGNATFGLVGVENVIGGAGDESSVPHKQRHRRHVQFGQRQ